MPIDVKPKTIKKIDQCWSYIIGRFCGKLALGLVLFAILVGGGAVFLFRSTIPSHLIREKLTAELHKHFGQTAKINIGDIKLDGRTAVVQADINSIRVNSPMGEKILSVPSIKIEFATSALAKLDLNPTAVMLKDVNISVVIAPNGQIAFNASKNSGELISVQESLKSLFSVLEQNGSSSAHQIPRLSLENGRVDIEDQRRGARYFFANINMDVEPDSDGRNAVTLKAKGQSGTISAKLMAGNEPLSFKLIIDRISVADIAAFSGLDLKTLSRDTALSLLMTSNWSQEAVLQKIEGHVSAGVGKIFIDDPEAKPIDVTDAHLDFSFLSDSQKLTISELRFDAGGVDMTYKGDISPVVSDQTWLVRLDLTKGVLKPILAQDKAVEITKSSVDALINPAMRVVKIQAFDLIADQLNSFLKGEFVFDERGRMGLSADLTLSQSDARNVLHIWPSFVAPELRTYLVSNLRAGIVSKAHVATVISAETFEAIKLRKPMPAESVSGDFTVNNAEVLVIPHVPPVSALRFNGNATGRVVSLSAIKGEVKLESGRILLINEGSVAMPDLAKHPIDAISNFKLSGSLEGVMELLSTPALKAFVPAGDKNAAIKGLFEGQVQISLPLKNKIDPENVSLQAKANLTNFSVENFLGKDSFEAPILQFVAQTGVFSLKGEGKAGGIPARIDLVQPRSGNLEDGAVTFTLDEAARAKRGINLSPQLKGPVSVQVKADFPVNMKAGLPMEVDLTKASIDGLLPNWVKAAGKPAKLKFTLNSLDNGYRLGNIELDGSAPKLKGSADLGLDGSVNSFQLTQLVLSTGDVMQVDGQKTAAGMKVNVRANSFDARPFLRGAPKNTAASTKVLELDMKAVALGGFNGEIAANADMRLVIKGNQLTQGAFSAKLNGVHVSGKTTPRSDGDSTVTLKTQNAGAVLRFMDVYNRMQGGEMDLQLTKSGATEAGYVNIHDFTLRDEPALKRASAAAATSNEASEQSAKRGFVADPSDVAFTKLHMDFTRKGDYFNVTDAVMWGNEVGGTLSGQLDYAKDYVNIVGTFVPAYGLNNAFAKIPVLGIFLAGNKYEGVFSVPFQISGRASQPNLSINPIAAVSPGIFRKIFEFRGAGVTAPPTGGE